MLSKHRFLIVSETVWSEFDNDISADKLDSICTVLSLPKAGGYPTACHSDVLHATVPDSAFHAFPIPNPQFRVLHSGTYIP